MIRVFSTLITFAYIPAVIAAFNTFSSSPFALNAGSRAEYERGKNRIVFSSSMNCARNYASAAPHAPTDLTVSIDS